VQGERGLQPDITKPGVASGWLCLVCDRRRHPIYLSSVTTIDRSFVIGYREMQTRQRHGHGHYTVMLIALLGVMWPLMALPQHPLDHEGLLFHRDPTDLTDITTSTRRRIHFQMKDPRAKYSRRDC